MARIVAITGLRRGASIVRRRIVGARSAVHLVSGSGADGCNGSEICGIRVFKSRARAASTTGLSL